MSTTANDRIILGIDPGTNYMGYGVLQITGNNPSLVSLGIVDMHTFENHYLKLKHIYERTIQLIDGYNPDELRLKRHFRVKMCSRC